MVIAFIAIFRTLLNACSPVVIHNFTKKREKDIHCHQCL